MSFPCCRQLFVCFIVFLFIVFPFFTPHSMAQPSPPSGTTLDQEISPETSLRDAQLEANKKALEKLGAMSPEEAEALDRSLAEALTLYYDGKYGQALPMFNAIASKVETMDIMPAP